MLTPPQASYSSCNSERQPALLWEGREFPYFYLGHLGSLWLWILNLLLCCVIASYQYLEENHA